ncbi:glycosyltransferase [Mycobacterium montefiorense]|uniref:Glycosyl transferase family 1 n=1 Tax=Mycobacterium montefiorense TaxID=154654 RepID=A0AA37PI22_9MYCO|nr:glycosyltransferase [Mycobacterium montefiorense]GBG37426.1 glycosyl transferase family 1 [Mycobacterium montefiorense]GKU36627.1 glycosyl transferase family 1 [Mycobacterium montefiorense]GKU42187.1 glycosyl transferase family 1 [Mycobacterium montefiorense]GKU45886.1 glycosyl transferase family 1 [Mycobacterium montefiorense]GKU53877.1 glycosyl transferase family 1 [Mycobacterium montefiorense]
MKFVLASYGTRGDIEPSVAVGRELLRRGHDVHMAVSPDLVGFAEAAGLNAVGYGLDTREWLDTYRDFWASAFHNYWKVPDLIRMWRELRDSVIRSWVEMSATLTPLADGADVLFTGESFMETAANVAEYYDMPLATLHYVPIRANGQLIPIVPSPLARSAMSMSNWLTWRMTKHLEDAQRRELGLPKATRPASRRIADRGSLEIQAYDQACFPGLETEWTKWKEQRPFVGALTMELMTDADEEVASWIAAGTPPICFGFGSTRVESPGDTVEMIGAACAQLGERALVCSVCSDFGEVPHFDNVKVVSEVNYAAIFPACRAVVHHGGTGTTAAGLRAGVPTLVLSMDLVQAIWGAQVTRLKVGAARRFANTTRESLVADLRRILNPECGTRAREFATRMSKPDASVANAADLLEGLADPKRSVPEAVQPSSALK